MEAPPSPLIPMPGASPQEEEEEISFFLASLATATTTTSCSSSSRTKKVTLSLLPASPDFMAFQGFVSLGVSTSEKLGRMVRTHRPGA